MSPKKSGCCLHFLGACPAWQGVPVYRPVPLTGMPQIAVVFSAWYLTVVFAQASRQRFFWSQSVGPLLQAVLRYRDLIQVEQLFRTAKSLMRTRPIYHSSDAAIRVHVFCSFLALVLRKELDRRCRQAGFALEWGDVLRDLDRLQRATIEHAGDTWTSGASTLNFTHFQLDRGARRVLAGSNSLAGGSQLSVQGGVPLSVAGTLEVGALSPP